MLNTRQIKARFWKRHTNKINGYNPCGILTVAEINPKTHLFGQSRPHMQVVSLDEEGKRHIKCVFEETTVADLDQFILQNTARPSAEILTNIINKARQC